LERAAVIYVEVARSALVMDVAASMLDAVAAPK
jgi:hypothetical protein